MGSESLLLETLTSIKALELSLEEEHPADMPAQAKEALVDRLTMVDSLVRGDKGAKRAQDLASLAEAQARLSFAPGADRFLGFGSKHRPRGPVQVGDTVRLSGKFLRNTGQYFKSLENDDQGEVLSLHGTADFQVATVLWNRYLLPGGENHLMECRCYPEERPTCALCKGSGRWYGRVNVKNLERLRSKQEEPPF